MFARIRRYGEMTEEGLRTRLEIVTPTVKELAGFRGYYFLFDRKNGKAMSITLWETEEALQASTGVAAARAQAQGPAPLS